MIEPAIAHTHEQDPSARIRVALIENDAIDRRALVHFVKKNQHPYEIIELSSFKEALVFVEKGACDIALIDYDLGDGNGLDLLPHFLDRHIPVIFVTGRGSEQVAVAAMRQGAADYLRKDTDRGYLQFLPITIGNVIKNARAEKERDQFMEELQAALRHIQTLRGLLPICAGCKKIRDEEGFWHAVEAYVSSHTMAEFSHSYCPECYDKARKELDETPGF